MSDDEEDIDEMEPEVDRPMENYEPPSDDGDSRDSDESRKRKKKKKKDPNAPKKERGETKARDLHSAGINDSREWSKLAPVRRIAIVTENAKLLPVVKKENATPNAKNEEPAHISVSDLAGSTFGGDDSRRDSAAAGTSYAIALIVCVALFAAYKLKSKRPRNTRMEHVSPRLFDEEAL